MLKSCSNLRRNSKLLSSIIKLNTTSTTINTSINKFSVSSSFNTSCNTNRILNSNIKYYHINIINNQLKEEKPSLSNTNNTDHTNTPQSSSLDNNTVVQQQQQDQSIESNNNSINNNITNNSNDTNLNTTTNSNINNNTDKNLDNNKDLNSNYYNNLKKLNEFINKNFKNEQFYEIYQKYLNSKFGNIKDKTREFINKQEYQEWIGKTHSLIDRIKQFYETTKYKLTYYSKYYLNGFKLIVADTKKYLQLKKEINNNRPFHLANRSEIYFTTQYSIELLKAIPFIVLFFPFSTIYFALAFIFPILLPTQLVLPRKKVQILNNINRLRKEQSKLIIDRLIQFTNLVNNRYIVVDDELMKECNRFTNILQNIRNFNNNLNSNNGNNNINGNLNINGNINELTHLERREYIKKFLKELKELDNTKFVDQFLKFNFMSTTLLDDICRFSLIGRSHLGGISGAIKEDNTSSIYGLRKYDPNILQQLLMNLFDVLVSSEIVQTFTPNTIKMYQLNRFINQLKQDDKFIKMDDQVSNVLGVKEEACLREWLKICYIRCLVQDPTCYASINTLLKTIDDLIMAGEHAPQTSTNTLLNISNQETQILINELKDLHDIWYDFTKDIKSNELLIVACILLK